MKDICAVSTPLAEGGISVIRISGENAISIGAKVFKPLSCKSVENMAGYTCAYGKIVDKNGREVDDGVLTVFRAPKSYTGENVCEISCHGGIYVTKKVLRLCIEQGAELAQRGEFTKRAFLNGKLSLTQAEGVMETISAQGEYALNSANLTKEGRLFRLISDMSRKFVTILGELAAWVDYPEEDLPEISEDNLRESLKNALAGLDKIIADHDSGMILKNGVDTVIAGKPNVGKSTLMNMIGGIDHPTSGSIIIDGNEIQVMSEDELAIFRRRNLGIVYQFYNLIPTLTAEENIALPWKLDGRKENKERLSEIVNMLGLEKRAKHLPGQMSGGQQQRVSIGRALINEPAFILADEPTGNLDSKTSREILDILKFTNQKYKQTILLVTHDEKIALQANRIITIGDGKIIKDEVMK